VELQGKACQPCFQCVQKPCGIVVRLKPKYHV
jgi:hypothetical protein